LDTTVLGLHDKQNTTQRYSTSKKDNTTIQGFHRVARKTIQEKYNRRFATVRYSSRRAKNLKGHPRGGYVDIMLAAEPLQPKPFVQDFIGS
jgi:hypothetical protein